MHSAHNVELTFDTARGMLCGDSAQKAATGLLGRLDSVQVQVVGVCTLAAAPVLAASEVSQSADNSCNSEDELYAQYASPAI